MSAAPNATPQLSPAASKPPKPRMSTRNRVLFLFTGWLIVLMPFLFWWSTWFGRQLPDKQLAEYLQDAKHPRHIQHALVQIGERMTRHDASVTKWYPQVVSLAAYPVEEVRNTDAWVMGQDVSGKDASDAGFHDALLKMLDDPSLSVRGNAALSLVRFGDASGRPQILELLQQATVIAPQSGKVIDTSAVGTAIRQGGIVAKLRQGDQTIEIRSPITGRLGKLAASTGQTVAAGMPIATIDPGTEQVWEALRALYLIGQPDDIAAVQPYELELPEIPNDVRRQAIETEKAIRERSAR
jgi:biotin carboxyl carrier protein